MALLRSLLFSVSMILATVIGAMVLLLASPLPFRARYRIGKTYARYNLWVLEKLCGIRYQVEGRENIPPGPAMIFCKHQSTWETLALQQIFPPQVWVLKRELIWVPFFGWGMALLNPIAIDRGAGRKAAKQIIEQGLDRLQQGLWVTVFPEGTRVAPGKRKKYAIGGALLAEKAGCPVVPVAHNAGQSWPRRGFVKKPGTIRVVIGPVIDTKDKSAAEITRLVEEWIEAETENIIGIKAEWM